MVENSRFVNREENGPETPEKPPQTARLKEKTPLFAKKGGLLFHPKEKKGGKVLLSGCGKKIGVGI